MRSILWLWEKRYRPRSQSCRPRIEWMEPRLLMSGGVSWTGAGGDNNWDDPSNWSTGAVPGPTQDVTINTSASIVHSSAVSDSIKSLTSTAPLEISGGTLSIASTSSLSGPLTIDGGTLTSAGNISVGGLLTLGSGAITGSGTVDASGGISVNPDGAAFDVAGNIALDSAATFAVGLNGAAPGTGYGQLNVDGTVNLAGSALHATLGFSPGTQSFTIIRSTAPIVGTFQGLPQGATTLIGGLPFKINYSGGNGDDVVLTRIGPVQPPMILSKDHATFITGNAGSFTVESIGGPIPALSEMGKLPSGVTFRDNGDGSATLAGTPAAGSGDTYQVTITADNGQAPNAVQTFTLTVDQPASFTSLASGSFVVGTARSVSLTTSGFPVAALSESGSLPAGLAFVDNGNGTATLGGTAKPGSSGTYHLMITAVNGVGTEATQDFALTVDASPAITSVARATFAAGAPAAFAVTTEGAPTAALTEKGPLPAGLRFVQTGDGNAKIEGTPALTSTGVYHLRFTAANGIGTAATQNFTLNVVLTKPPEVVGLRRLAGRGPTRIVLYFDEPMNPDLTQLPGNYVLRPVVRGKPLTGPRRTIRVVSAAYDPAHDAVVVTVAKRLGLKKLYQITVNGVGPRGVANISGVALDGRRNGLPGTDFVTLFAGRGIR
jgi:hypothetical protein